MDLETQATTNKKTQDTTTVTNTTGRTQTTKKAARDCLAVLGIFYLGRRVARTCPWGWPAQFTLPIGLGLSSRPPHNSPSTHHRRYFGPQRGDSTDSQQNATHIALQGPWGDLGATLSHFRVS